MDKVKERRSETKEKKMAAWICARCQKKLPKKGRVWSHRERESREYRMRKDSSGYYCDNCADARESNGGC